MSEYIFTFSLHTEKDVVDGSIFDTNGEVLGRVIHKFISQTGNGVTYDIETTKETFDKIDNGEIKLWGIEKYYVTTSHTAYYRD